jgi:hypothetical protein
MLAGVKPAATKAKAHWRDEWVAAASRRWTHCGGVEISKAVASHRTPKMIALAIGLGAARTF